MDKELIGYTYADLRRAHIGRLEEEQKSLQQIRNHTSTLQLFMRAIGKHDSDDYFEDFTGAFEERLVDFHSWSTSNGVSSGTIANRVSCLRSVKETVFYNYTKFDTIKDFSNVLKSLIVSKGICIAELARKTCVSRKKIASWLHGVLPDQRSLSCLGRIELYFQITNKALQRKVVENLSILADGKSEMECKSWKNSHLIRNRYLYKEPTPQIIQEWMDMVNSYTSPYLIGGYKRNSTWRTKDITKILKKAKWQGKTGDRYCITAEIRWTHFACMFGYLLLDHAKGGKSFTEGELSLALATDAHLVIDYIEFRRSRSGVYTGEIKSLISFFSSLLRENTGYLWQRAEYGARLKKPVAMAQWHSWCEQNRNLLGNVLKDLTKGGHIRFGRDPKAPIQHIIAMQHPIEAIFKMVKRMERQAALNYGKYSNAIKHRDILLVKMMVSNPLRVSQFSIMTFREDNTGNLYQGDAGEWRLRFSPDDFKNQKGAASQKYDVVLSQWLYEDIHEYIHIHRRVLFESEKSDYLFLSGKTRPSGDERILYWLSQCISERIHRLTKKFIPNCAGFHAHAFRHIVATDFIKNNPNGYQVAASILHDKLETVMREYAHIKVADGFSHWTNYFDAQVEASKGAKHE